MYRPSAVCSAICSGTPFPTAGPRDDLELLVRSVIIAPALRGV
jgi:hypothetical protein